MGHAKMMENKTGGHQMKHAHDTKRSKPGRGVKSARNMPRPARKHGRKSR